MDETRFSIMNGGCGSAYKPRASSRRLRGTAAPDRRRKGGAEGDLFGGVMVLVMLESMSPESILQHWSGREATWSSNRNTLERTSSDAPIRCRYPSLLPK